MVSLAKQIAAEMNIRYENIDVPASTREGLYYQRREPLNDDHTAKIDMMDDVYARSWNLVREWHMIQSINAVVNPLLNSSGGRILVICGLLHVEAIKRHLPAEVTVDGGLFYTMAR
jgi:hypothetical protein